MYLNWNHRRSLNLLKAEDLKKDFFPKMLWQEMTVDLEAQSKLNSSKTTDSPLSVCSRVCVMYESKSISVDLDIFHF